MSDVVFILILLAFFALAIGVVQVLSRMLERDIEADRLADEHPDAGDGFPNGDITGQAGPR